jgi:hypothetical protein
MNKPLKELKAILLEEIEKWKNSFEDNEQQDDMTVIGVEIGQKSEYKDKKEIFKYEGIITQNVISAAVDNIDEIDDLRISSKLATIVIEMAQNIMHYMEKVKGSKAFIEIYYDENSDEYVVITRNVVLKEDKELIEQKLKEIKTLSKDEIKKRYKELRRSGLYKHDKGGGIGFYEIAKLADSISFKFEQIDEDRFNFEFIAKLKSKR